MTREFSLSAKLGALDIGEQIALPDDWDRTSPSHMERAVGTMNTRPPKAMTGRRFTTSRVVLTHRMAAEPIPIPMAWLIVTRAA